MNKLLWAQRSNLFSWGMVHVQFWAPAWIPNLLGGMAFGYTPLVQLGPARKVSECFPFETEISRKCLPITRSAVSRPIDKGRAALEWIDCLAQIIIVGGGERLKFFYKGIRQFLLSYNKGRELKCLEELVALPPLPMTLSIEWISCTRIRFFSMKGGIRSACW